LIAVEIDRDLAAALAPRVPSNVEIVTADVLDVDLDALLPLGTRVVGNLPYNVSSPILFRLLDAAREGQTIRDATLMLQKEVVDRLAAQPGSRDYGVLAIQVARVADVERLFTLPPGAFRPPPKVTSAVVRLRFRSAPIDVGDPRTFERVVRGAFLQRRKTALNALGPVADSLGLTVRDWIAAARIDPALRPGALTLDDFARLARVASGTQS
jgi:16S rRNA (adenine1518-N6/adenine1519-N6)-dimethyltransferase